MAERYDFRAIEEKWQKYWEENNVFRTDENSEKEKYYVKEHHIPIISRELWNKCQEILNKRRNEMSDSQHHAKHYCYRYTFSSKIECGICGSSYVHRISGKQKEKQYFYQ